MSNPIKLSTTVIIPPQKEKISCETKILTLGSCFSNNIGNRLSTHFFDTMVNPFGTVFNPFSIAKVLSFAMNNVVLEKADLQYDMNRYFHYDFHSTFDSVDPSEVLEKTNAAIGQVKDYIQNVDFLILTFGTSIVYKLKENAQIVSNCHKVSNHKFEKEFLSTNFIQDKMERIIELIKSINPSINIILTVSPVRHTKEGLIENSLSKSRLIDLCHSIGYDQAEINYFPAFEIMVDELRDYRYYKSDLIHPSDLAIDIIWSRFMAAYFDEKAIQKVKDVKELITAKNHIPFDPNSDGHQIFKQNQLKKIERFQVTYPEIDFQEMIEYFKA